MPRVLGLRGVGNGNTESDPKQVGNVDSSLHVMLGCLEKAGGSWGVLAAPLMVCPQVLNPTRSPLPIDNLTLQRILSTSSV